MNSDSRARYILNIELHSPDNPFLFSNAQPWRQDVLFAFIVWCLGVSGESGRVLIVAASSEIRTTAVRIGTKLVAVFARLGGIARGRKTQQAREVSSNKRSDCSDYFLG